MPQPSGHARRFKADMNRQNRKTKQKNNRKKKDSTVPTCFSSRLRELERTCSSHTVVIVETARIIPTLNAHG